MGGGGLDVAEMATRALMTIRIYLAGPDVFLRNALEIGERKKAMCMEYGFEGKFPFDASEHGKSSSTTIFQRNRDAMKSVNIGLFNLSPFRGANADVGTVFELGYMLAAGKRVFGYSSSASTYRTRVAKASNKLIEESNLVWDDDGLIVEDFNLVDNLMVCEGIMQSGGFIETMEEDGANQAERLAAFGGFRRCLQRISEIKDDLM